MKASEAISKALQVDEPAATGAIASLRKLGFAVVPVHSIRARKHIQFMGRDEQWTDDEADDQWKELLTVATQEAM